jgi:DNA-binding MarR family transcriptional regulator
VDDGDGPEGESDGHTAGGDAIDRDPGSTGVAEDAPGDRLSPPGGPIDALERIVIGSVGITTQALANAAPDVELTFSQWRALLILGDPPTGYRVGEVATRVGVTLPATSRLLRRLARRGLVALAPDESDRRATRATLTDEGAKVRDAILAYRRAALRDIAEHASPARGGLTGAAIDSLARSFERYA